MPAGAAAEASATVFVEDFFKKGRAPRPNDCVAAASASASAFSSAKGGDAFSFAKAQADASSFVPGSQGWRNKFIGACTARASASAESFSSGGKGGGFAGELLLHWLGGLSWWQHVPSELHAQEGMLASGQLLLVK